MKKFKVLVSAFMVIIIFSVSFVQTFAVVVESATQEIIQDNLAALIEKSSNDEKIPIYIWYKDVSQNDINILVEKKTGLNEDSLSEKLAMPDIALLNEIKKNSNNVEKNMEAYLAKTKNVRAKEKENTDKYIQTRRDFSRLAYNEKSKQIKDIVSIDKSDIIFNSQYAPFIICELTKSQIIKLKKDNRIESIGYYQEPYTIECTDESVKGTTGQSKLESLLGLTGYGVNVGMVDGGYPLADDELDLSEIIMIGSPSYHGHATNTAKILKGKNSGFAKNMNLYSTDANFNNIELMLTAGVKIINVSFGWVFFESNTSSDYAYNYVDKWFDHIVSYHNITVIASAGNDALGKYYNNNPNLLYKKVLSPAMAYNVIAVGAYNDKYTIEFADDQLNATSSYKNTNGTIVTRGIEKPDVVMPCNTFDDYGGTSSAAPTLTALIAQLFELKPSLAVFPQSVKAIVLASCHRKVIQTTAQGGQETMEQGITERQGAGAPDAWTMACIISHGTYGMGVLSSNSTTHNIVQPKYSADNINFSLAWLRENIDTNTNLINNDASDIQAGQASNLDLSISQNNTVVKSSNLNYSSTEMCYLPLSDTDFNYRITISQKSTLTPVRYAYAWSTDDMDVTPISDEGIYHIKNKSSNRYLTSYTSSGTVTAVTRAISSQSAISNNHKWVVKQNGTTYNILPGSEIAPLYLGISSTTTGTSYKSELSTVVSSYNLVYNDDGTYSILNLNNNRVLSVSGSSVVWNVYDGSSSFDVTQKWYFEKANYLRGDVNIDGAFDNNDKLKIQYYLAQMSSLNNIEFYLSDVNYDGSITIMDASLISDLY